MYECFFLRTLAPKSYDNDDLQSKIKYGTKQND